MQKILILTLLIPLLAFASGTQPFFSQKIITGCDVSTASCTSIGLNVNQMSMASVQMIFSGSPNGTIKMQVSNDKVQPSGTSDPAANVVNWTDYTPSITSISTSGTLIWNIHSMGYQWVRIVYTKISGTGSLNATLEAKGI